MRLVVTDLDGTLLRDDKTVSVQDLATLEKLGERRIVRVAATGRNLLSAKHVLVPEFPIDYLIFSSGAGIYQWPQQQLLTSNFLPAETVERIARILIQYQIDFMIHELIPDNHHFLYYQSPHPLPDFFRRMEIYRPYARPLDLNARYNHACQLVAIFPNELDFFMEIKRKLAGVKVIRATSPIDGKSIWMEIFPEQVSKARGTQLLCEKYHINSQQVLCVGNDYNDLDMLQWAKMSFVVANAPGDLRSQFRVCSSNMQSGVSDAVNQVMSLTAS